MTSSSTLSVIGGEKQMANNKFLKVKKRYIKVENIMLELYENYLKLKEAQCNSCLQKFTASS